MSAHAAESHRPGVARPVGRDAPVGGQAVIEGVMMRGVSTWAVAIRRPPEGGGGGSAGVGSASGGREPGAGARGVGSQEAAPRARGLGSEEVEPGATVARGVGSEEVEPSATGVGSVGKALGAVDVQTFGLVNWRQRRRSLRLPVLRGVAALAESLAIGYRALRIAAHAQLGAEEKPIPAGVWAGTVAAGLGLAVGLFFVLPVALTSLVKDELGSPWRFWLVEGMLRTAIFLAYLALLSRLRDLRRLFEYHGAEHKVIAAYEAGEPLTPEHAQRYPRLHPRCGTSFLLVVMVVAIFVFAPLGLPAWYWLVASRILGVPLIAGLSFEVIKWAGRNRSKPWVRAVMAPGLALQRLTTREPDLAQLAVAVAALQAVLDVEDPRAAAAEERVGMEVVA